MKVLMRKTNKIEEVNDSYALNFLIPKGLALMATDRVIEKVRHEEAEKATEAAEKKSARQELAKSLNGKIITIKSKANEEGQLYGAVTAVQIKKALKIKEKVTVFLDEPISATGSYPVKIKIGSEPASVTVEVLSS